jgi:hypothetical protein
VQAGHDLQLQVFRKITAVLVIKGAGIGYDGEAGGNGKAETCHFGKVRALAAQYRNVTCPAFGSTVAEGINPFFHSTLSTQKRCHFSIIYSIAGMLETPQHAVYIAVQHNCGKLRARIAAKSK